MVFSEGILRLCRNGDSDLTVRQLGVMVYVSQIPEAEGKTLGLFQVVARELQMSKPAMTRAIMKLDALGLVTRKFLPTDQRQFQVALTVEGRAFLRDSGLWPEEPKPYVLVSGDEPRLVGPFETAKLADRWLDKARSLPGEDMRTFVGGALLEIVEPTAEAARRKAAYKRKAA